MRVVFRAVLLTLFILLPVVAYSDSEREPSSYATISSNGKYLFVMLAPGETQTQEIPLVYLDSRNSKYLTPKYPVSGLYLNDGSTTPLWTVDWYAFSVLLLSDGVHLIRRGPWARHLSDEALTFIANGQVLRSYRISDLVDTAVPLSHTVSHFRWEESFDLNEREKTLELATFSKEKYTFDYRTGEIVSSRRPLRAFFVIVALITLFIAARLIKRRKRFAGAAI